jgi:CRISPR-associated protein Csx17
MTAELRLSGCSPTPLASYLKALGVLRVVAEQSDPGAHGWWEGDGFVLRGRLDRDALEAFFLSAYEPTPVLAPWNGGSGFFFREEKLQRIDPATGKRVKTGRRTEATEATRTVAAMLASRAPRFERYRVAIGLVREILAASGLEEAPRALQKADLVRQLRARLPAEAAAWLDAVICLTGEEARFPPLLGTGGNDGNLDFTNNFMQRLLELFDPQAGNPAAPASDWLRGALFGDAVSGLKPKAIGQFAPLGAGGPNASAGFSGALGTNLWDSILMLEGALLFAAAATRRLESSDPAALSYPFASRFAGVGSGASAQVDEGASRDEIWLPLWRRPAMLPELRALLAEGRVTVGRRPARDSLDFTRAVAALGVDRGIDEFVRYGFLQRLGRMFLATPLGRIEVRANPQAELIADLEHNGYLESVRRLARRGEAPARTRQLVHRLEAALFEMARRGDRQHVQETLGLLGALQRVLGTSKAAREAIPLPAPHLNERWALAADDGSDEFRIAAALAGIHAPGLPMRVHLAAIKPGRRSDTWEPGTTLAVWGPGPLIPNLVRLLDRRLLAAERIPAGAEREEQGDKPFGGAAPADVPAVLAFLGGETDDERIARLLQGLALVRLPLRLPSRDRGREEPAPAALAILEPFFTPDGLLRRLEVLPTKESRLPLPRRLVPLLAAGRLDSALREAWRRLRLAGVRTPSSPPVPPSGEVLDVRRRRRLLAALFVPLDARAIQLLARRLTASDHGSRPEEANRTL